MLLCGGRRSCGVGDDEARVVRRSGAMPIKTISLTVGQKWPSAGPPVNAAPGGTYLLSIAVQQRRYWLVRHLVSVLDQEGRGGGWS